MITLSQQVRTPAQLNTLVATYPLFPPGKVNGVPMIILFPTVHGLPVDSSLTRSTFQAFSPSPSLQYCKTLSRS